MEEKKFGFRDNLPVVLSALFGFTATMIAHDPITGILWASLVVLQYLQRGQVLSRITQTLFSVAAGFFVVLGIGAVKLVMGPMILLCVLGVAFCVSVLNARMKV
jgi:hypothetical protein